MCACVCCRPHYGVDISSQLAGYPHRGGRLWALQVTSDAGRDAKGLGFT